ncbi:ATP-binding cassette, subfamily B, bacterial IrtA/YbtP [Staphylococcus auricularis]|uniref:ABC transporter ATP-binding protein n=1 Tax=Staphylococcus auricularis TaxID=29379 RepID=A0AAP8TTH7_9STAP|nr:ABC transporter ATP-binding protein [Staphylococcus auricularis]MBM0868244.1 ABC transporter ATP-binding protein [Staphylococcus auricularis]MCG7340741.1 ABC transporter ATP-binding protein/permease [Staphylococcus auricularis]MDC6327246.1 ABC transporter ATP-binding protein [Staphylococcus auricularis]MDN4533044.1 ABC transporter ATP-binding protein [Staphylococcus auricularis]MDN4533454.1 ABC transporter ATP-binding protein [Staphylococcus auricularis]
MNTSEHWIKSLIGFGKDSQFKIILSVLLSIISVFAGLVPYWAVYKIIILMIEGPNTLDQVLPYIGIAAGAYILQLLSFGGSTMLSHVTAYDILSTIRKQLAQKLMRLPLGVVESKKIGELKSIFVDKVETIELPLAHMIPELIGNLLLSIAIFCYIVVIDWRMACAMLITVPIAFFAFKRLMSGFNETYETQMASNNYMNSAIVEYIEGIEVIKTFNQSQNSYQKYKDAVNNYKAHTLSWFEKTWGYMNLGASVLPSTFLGVLPVGMYLVSIQQLSYAQFFLCLVLSLGVVAPIKNFTNYVNQLKSIQYAITEVRDVLDLDELAVTDQFKTPQNHDIRFNDVGFSYSGDKDDLVFDHLSFSIPQQTFTAIVGASGSGKSTIAKLLARFWDVASGAITIGGVNIKELDPKQLNDFVGFVGQDNFLLNLTFKENIKLGNPEATDEEVVEAAKLAQCHTFIEKLPEGYDTLVGTVGDKLSGGEKQRVTIARMILKDAPIIVLDEATAYVDPDNEQKIQGALNALTQNKTLIVIAHRLSTIKEADQIIVLGEQHIVEKGDHQTLLDKKGTYHHMWQMHVGAKDWGVSS